MTTFDSYQSPFSGRYGSKQLRSIWSEKTKRTLWRQAWMTLLLRQESAGIISLTSGQIAICNKALAATYEIEDYEDAQAYESITRHDLVAELKTFKDSLPKAIAEKLHLGITSSDIVDYADIKRLRRSASLMYSKLNDVIGRLSNLVLMHSGSVVLGYTHLQPAEPTTLGYRMGLVLQELRIARLNLLAIELPDYGFRGAVGTGANLLMLVDGQIESVKKMHSYNTGITGQTYPRQIELRLANCLGDIACTLHKLGLDIRLMASQEILYEEKTQAQVGSSAMPTKVNPIRSEKLCSLARLMPGHVRNLWDCAANSALERTLDDSASRRSTLPEMFLVTDELLSTALDLFKHLVFDEELAELQANDAWRAWLPSRVQTLLACAGKEANQKDLEKLAHGSMSWQAYLSKVLPGYAWNGPLEDWYYLDYAAEQAQNLAKKA